MDEIFQKLVDSNFSELRGMTADFSIPIPEPLLNELLKTTLQENKTVSAVDLSIHSQNRLAANIRMNAFPWPLNLKLKLDTSVDLASYASPKMRAWLENNRLLGSLGSMFNILPEGVKLYDDQLVIDIGALLRAPEQKRLLELVKFIGVTTEEGRMILDIKVEVT